MSISRRKRCPFCHCLYWPDPRTRWRQWACSKPECQEKRKVESQRRWRAKNPSDKAGRRYREAVNAVNAGGEASGVPPKRGPLTSLPWDDVRDEIPAEVLVFLVLFGRLLLRVLEDERRSQTIGNTAESGRLLQGVQEDETDEGGPGP